VDCLDENTLLAFIEGRLGPDGDALVDRHLAGCESCREMVALSAGVVLSVTAAAGMVPGPEKVVRQGQLLARGATVGRYVVLGLVGRGAMGEVYAAFDPELNRKIALKLIKSDAASGNADEDARRRLLREAKAIARLSHANIVVVHDAGTIEGRVFIAMEFVEGQTLNEWRRGGRHSWREILEVFLAAGRGLVHAHAAGVVHRDFKPHNVMLGNDGAVRVMDFGLASEPGGDEAREAAGPSMASAQAADLAGLAATVSPAMTHTGMLIGTPAYMAPEQFLAARADARSDQFSFCVALYEALYGERPFEGADIGELAKAVTAGQVREIPPRSRVPARLRRALLRGLRPQREQRFPSMTELLAELGRNPERQRRRILAGGALGAALLAVGAASQRSLVQPAALCRDAAQHLANVWELPGAAGPAPRHDAVKAAFTATGLASASETWTRVGAALDEYARGWVSMSTESCEATHRRGEQSAEVLDLRTTCLTGSLQGLRALTDVLARADRAVVQEAVSAVNALPDLSRCADVRTLKAATPPPRDPAARARVEALSRRLAEVAALRDTGKLDAARPLASALVTDARALGYDPTLARALEQDCWLKERAGLTAKAIPSCEEAVWTAEASREDEIAAAMSTQLIALSFSSKARREDSERWAKLAAAILKRMGPGHGKLEGWLEHNQAYGLEEMGEWTEARRHYERAIALKTAAEGPDDVDLAVSLNNYGNVLHEMGDNEAGLVALRRARAIWEHAYGAGSRMIAMPLNNEGEILNTLGRPREAIPVFQRTLEVMEASDIDPSSAWLPYPLTGMGQSLLALGRPGEAVGPLERALVIRDRIETFPLPRGETRFALARALWDSGGDRARARALAKSARAEYESATSAAKTVAEIDAWLAAHGRG
jgi:tetratricopeptide (TPR) repeat protein/predicted Ser/Thr protein kinase